MGGHLFWGILLVTGLGLLVWRMNCGNSIPTHADRTDSLELLKMRLARGEISVEEFARLKEYL